MYPRRLVLKQNDLAHVFFRCHNRQPLLKDADVKEQLMWLWAKYKMQYQIRVYEFIVMDNHVHMLIHVSTTEALGHFMRTVNSQLARYINKKNGRDSQAIRERFKSPLITDRPHFRKVRNYIWFNRVKANLPTAPDRDPFCSASWKANPSIIKALNFSEEQMKLIRVLLDPLPPGIDPELDSVMSRAIKGKKSVEKILRRYYLDALNAAKSLLTNLKGEEMCSSHTIGSKDIVQYRRDVLMASKKEYIPWEYHDPNPPTVD